MHKVLDDLFSKNGGASGNALRAGHPVGYRSVGTDGHLHLAGGLGERGLNGSLDDLIYGD